MGAIGTIAAVAKDPLDKKKAHELEVFLQGYCYLRDKMPQGAFLQYGEPPVTIVLVDTTYLLMTTRLFHLINLKQLTMIVTS